jgi:hypothetical protein
MKDYLFRRKSIERLSTPEELTDYIRVTRPGIWIVIGAAVVLLIGLLIWGIYGAIPDAVETTGVAKGGTVVCYVNNASNLSAGMDAAVDGTACKVVSIGERPLSKNEVSKIYQEDYTLYMLNVGDWNYAVTIEGADVPDGLVQVKITGRAISPITFLEGDAAN